MRRVIGIDIHRTFGEVVIWEHGRLWSFGPLSFVFVVLRPKIQRRCGEHS